MTEKIKIHLTYSCPTGRKTEAERPLVVDALKNLLPKEHFYVVAESKAADAWVVVDGSLANTPASIEVLGEYVEFAARKTGGPFGYLPWILILTHGANRWQKSGFRFPSEFLLPLSRVVELPDRLKALHVLHGKTSDPGFSLAEFRDFVVGNLRENLGLDHSHHGTTSNLQNAEVDLKQLAQRYLKDANRTPTGSDPEIFRAWVSDGRKSPSGKTIIPWPEEIGKTSAAGKNGLYAKLFPKTTKATCKAAQGVAEEIGKLKNGKKPITAARNILTKRLPDMRRAYPRWLGHGLASLPACKLLGLVVDDQVAELLERLDQTEVQSDQTGRPMKQLIDFHPAFPPAKTTINYLEALQEFLRHHVGCGETTICPRCIDFVLLDLSFTAGLEQQDGAKAPAGTWADPLGWRMLPILRKWFPDIPIIIHSWFASSTQVRLAYERGADWFLPKDDDHKLPSHLFQLLEHPNWQREWAANKGEVDFDPPPGRPLREHERYLWWKCMEGLPGDHVRIRQLGGGISTAVTAKAWKRINGRYDRLPPIIIKIDHPFEMGMEQERYRRFIAPYLSNRAGRIQQPPFRAGRKYSAITYTCAGSSQGVSEGSNRTEILPLLKLLEMNFPTRSREVIPADQYDGLFRQLLEDTLPRIHGLAPAGDADFPNPVFGEYANPLSGYIFRYPPTKKVELKSPIKPPKSSIGTRLLLLGANRQETELEAIIPAEDRKSGLIERVVLTGPIARHYCKHRRLRKHQMIRIEGSLTPIDATEQWPKPHESYKKILSQFVPDCEFNEIGKKLCEIRDYLTSGGARFFKSLSQGVIHGDLNLGNLMVERRLGAPPLPVSDEAWMIDFAWSRRDAIAIDYTQFEMDLLIRLGKPHLFADGRTGDPDLQTITEFRDSYLETPWEPAKSVTTDPGREFLYRIMKQVRDAADRANIDSPSYAHVRLATLLITAKIRLKSLKKAPDAASGTTDPDGFAAALCLNWILRQYELIKKSQ